MNASFSGWGVVLNAHPAYSLWECCHVIWHLITWKTRPVFLAMKIISPISVGLPCFGPVGQHIGSLKGRLCLRPLFRLVQQILLCTKNRLLSLGAVYIPGQFEHAVQLIWQRYDRAEVDLFASIESIHYPSGSPSYFHLHLGWMP